MRARHIVLIDNFDSFTFNLVDYFKQCGAQVTVYCNDVAPAIIMRARPRLVVYSPGPGNPKRAGHLLEYIDYFTGRLPQFGVCLGLQAMIEANGGSLRVLKQPLHGKTSLIQHDGKTIFTDLPNPLSVGRYHSLAASAVPNEFEVSATTVADQTVMAIRHRRLPIEAVQFHPESILTSARQVGLHLIDNVLNVLAWASIIDIYAPHFKN